MPSVPKMNISFLVTVLNETDSLRRTVDAIWKTAAADVREILIIIADRTTPASRAVISELMGEYPGHIRVHQQTLPCLGGALREGFREARGDFLLLMASDLETDPAVLPQMIAAMKTDKWDIVATSRWREGGGFEGYHPLKFILNYLFQQFFRWVYWTNLTDLTFGYRLYRRTILDGIIWEELRHPFLLECLLKPLRRGARVTEVACPWRPRPEGDSANTFLRTFSYLRTAVKTRLLPVGRFCSALPAAAPPTSARPSVPADPPAEGNPHECDCDDNHPSRDGSDPAF